MSKRQTTPFLHQHVRIIGLYSNVLDLARIGTFSYCMTPINKRTKLLFLTKFVAYFFAKIIVLLFMLIVP